MEAPYSFKGQLLGKDAGDQGNEAVGVWSLGTSGNTKNYLAGGFGAMRGADLPDIRPEPDAGEGAQTKILSQGDIRPDFDASTVTDTHTGNDANGTVDEVIVAKQNLGDTTHDSYQTADPFSDTDNPDTRGQTVAGGMLTVIGRKYDHEGNPILDNKRDVPDSTSPLLTGDDIGAFKQAYLVGVGKTTFPDDSTANNRNNPKDSRAATQDDYNADGTAKAGREIQGIFAENNTVNDAEYRSHKIDLVAALDGGVKWSNGDKHVAIAKAAIEKELRILESDIGLDESVKKEAWERVKTTILENLFKETAFTETKGAAFNKTYSLSSNADFVRATAEALEALQNNDALKAALATGGVFNGLAPANGKAGDPKVNLFDRLNSRVQYAVSSGDTAFTRFGAWRRETSPNAESDYVKRTESAEGDGPGSLAYSNLAKTVYSRGLSSDPRYPKGARLTYEGGTIAVVGDAFFEGMVSINVLWGSAVGADGTADTADDVINASLSMSISDIENMANAAPLYLDTDVTEGENLPADVLEEVLSIDISNIDVNAMLALSADATDTTVVVSSSQGGQVQPRRTNFVGTVTGATGTGNTATADMVAGQFVGLGVSGPLAVLGTWNMSNRNASNSAIGAKVTKTFTHTTTGATMEKLSVTGVTLGTPADHGTQADDSFTAAQIHAGFGAELP